MSDSISTCQGGDLSKRVILVLFFVVSMLFFVFPWLSKGFYAHIEIVIAFLVVKLFSFLIIAS